MAIDQANFELSILPNSDQLHFAKRCLKSKTIGKDIGKDSTGSAKIQQCFIIGKFARWGGIHYMYYSTLQAAHSGLDKLD